MANSYVQVKSGSNKSFYQQDSSGNLYPVTDKDTVRSLKDGKIRYTSVANDRPLKFADTPSTTGGTTSSTGTTGETEDLSALFKNELVSALKSMNNPALRDAKARREQVIQRTMAAPAVLDRQKMTPSAMSRELSNRGSEFSSALQSADNQVKSFQEADAERIQKLQSLSEIASSLDPAEEKTAEIRNYEYGINDPNFAQFYSDQKKGTTYNGLDKDQRALLNQIQDNARQDPDIKVFSDVRAAYDQAERAAATGNGAGDIVLMRMLAKITDPTTGVREEEFETFQAAQSTLERYGIKLTSQMIEGDRLSEAGRAALAKQARNVYEVRERAYENSYKFYDDQAVGSGIPPRQIAPYLLSETTDSGDPEKKTYQGVDYIKVDGGWKRADLVTVNVGKGAGVANNNPGNLKFMGQKGATQGSGGFAKFGTPQEGYLALQKQIDLDTSRDHTLTSFISKYAPPTENDTKTYIAQAVKALGVGANTPLSRIDRDALAEFIAWKESQTTLA